MVTEHINPCLQGASIPVGEVENKQHILVKYMRCEMAISTKKKKIKHQGMHEVLASRVISVAREGFTKKAIFFFLNKDQKGMRDWAAQISGGKNTKWQESQSKHPEAGASQASEKANVAEAERLKKTSRRWGHIKGRWPDDLHRLVGHNKDPGKEMGAYFKVLNEVIKSVVCFNRITWLSWEYIECEQRLKFLS